MEPKIAVAMIVKGVDEEAQLLDNCLSSFEKYVDAIYVDINLKDPKKISQKVIDVCKNHKANYRLKKWEDNFVQARNESFDQVPEEYDFIGWIDADDVWDSPENIKPVLRAVPKHIEGLMITYDYSFDVYGNLTLDHDIVRIVRNNGSFRWKAAFDNEGETVHETLVETRRVGVAMNKEFKITHRTNDQRQDASLARNINILEKMLDKNKVTPDPRVLYYLATHYRDAGRYQDTKQLLTVYLKLSGFKDERAQAYVHLGDIERVTDREKAKELYLFAIGENPQDPSPYIELGELEFENGNYQDSIRWLEMGVMKKEKSNSVVRRPMETTYRAFMLLGQSHANLGGKSLDIAKGWIDKAFALRPLDPEVIEAQDKIDELIRHRDVIKASMTVIRTLEKDDESKENIVKLIDSLPKEVQDSPPVLNARRFYSPPKIWPKKSVVIFAGAGPLGVWTPESLKEGIGGSEEAIIRMSRQLVLEGYQVVVYATPGNDVGNYDGVEYKNYWEINLRDTFDIFISWRAPHHFDADIKAKKTYMWIHDVMDKGEFTPERIAKCHKIMFLSEYQRSLYPFIPDEKIFLSRNGIDIEDFVATDGKFQRDPHRVIYMSSHVRGLQLIYEVWDDVKKAVPDAKLDIYYGWGSFEAVNRGNPERMAWMAMMQKRAESLKDVTDHGKIGQLEIVEEIQKSGVWAYPCPFPEISCITAMKAQAGGAVPVSSDFAALDETVQYGTKITMKQMDPNTPVGAWDKNELDKFKKALISMLQNKPKQDGIRKVMMKWAREKLTWNSIAKEWIQEFES